MPRLTDLQLAPLGNDDLFEDLCCELWKREWNDPTAQRHGRSGQSQQGVDVYGRRDEGAYYDGVQCKAVAKPLTETELQREIDQAKQFDPPLKRLIVATTAPQDAKLEKYCRRITQAHVEQKLFSVTVLGWRNILRLLEKYPDLIERFSDVSVQSSKVAESVVQALEPRLSGLEQTLSNQAGLHASLLFGPLLDDIRDAINGHRSREALRRLDEFRNRCWSQADSGLRFRVALYQGEANLALGDELEAAKFYLEAYGYKPDEEAALTHVALAYLAVDDNEKAAQFARKAVSDYPASTLACAVLINAAIPDADLEELLETEIPAPIRNSTEVLMNLASVSQRRGDLAAAETWIRQAVQSATSGHPKLFGLFGNILLAKAMKSASSLLAKAQNDPDVQDLLVEAEAAFTRAWDQVAETDLKVRQVGWLINRGVIRRLQNRFPEATSDAELAIQIVPSRPEALHLRALIALENKEYDHAIGLLKTCVAQQSSQKVQYALLLAQVFGQQGTQESLREAASVLTEAQHYSLSPAEYDAIESLRAETALEQGEDETAQAAAERLLKRSPTPLANLTIAASVARQTGDLTLAGRPLSAVALLERAQEQVTGATPDVELADLAAELYRNELYDKAAVLYERLAVKGRYDPFSWRLLQSHFHAREFGKALEVAQEVIAANGPSPSFSEAATAISEEIGDLPTARRVAEQYVAAYPNDLGMQLRLAMICVRQGDDPAIDAFLGQPLTVEGMEVEEAIRVASLFERRSQTERALRFSYDIRERFFGAEEAHLSFFMRFMRLTSQHLLPLLDVLDGVAIDTTVTVQEEGQADRVYWIEEQPVRHDAFHLTPNHAFAKLLLGKKPGDPVSLPGSDLYPRVVTVKEVKSKYVQAFQDSMTNYQIWFPEADDVRMMRVPDVDDAPDADEARRQALRPVLDTIDRNAQQWREMETAYQEKWIPLHAIGKRAGHDLRTMWIGFTRRPGVGVRCCSGDTGKLDEAVRLLQGSPRLVADPLALLTLYHLPCRDAVLATTGKLITSQSVLDEFRDIAEHQKADRPDGHTAVGRVEDGYVVENVTGDDVEAMVREGEALHSWVNSNTEVHPVRLLLKDSTPELRQFRQTIEAAYADPIFIAKEAGLPLLTDDGSLRLMAAQWFSVGGIWTQALLVHALNIGAIDANTYDDAAIWLVQHSYNYTFVRPETITRAASQAKWRAAPPYTSVLGVLGGTTSDDSAVGVAVEVMRLLSLENLISIHLDALLTTLLDAVAAGRDTRKLLASMEKQIHQRFLLVPLQGEQIIAVVNAWLKTRII